MIFNGQGSNTSKHTIAPITNSGPPTNSTIPSKIFNLWGNTRFSKTAMKCAHPKVMIIAIVHSFQLSVMPTHRRHSTITKTQSNVFSMEKINLLITFATTFEKYKDSMNIALSKEWQTTLANNAFQNLLRLAEFRRYQVSGFRLISRTPPLYRL